MDTFIKDQSKEEGGVQEGSIKKGKKKKEK